MDKIIKYKKYLYTALSFMAIVLCVFFIKRAEKETIFGDIHVFWRAGKYMLEGKDIYFTPAGQRGFIYPPFAALAFIPLSLLEFKFAVFIFFIINCIAWFLSFFYVKKILEIKNFSNKTINMTLFLTFILSFKLCWNNLMTIQVNQIVFLFSILSIYYFLIKKELISVLFLSIGISLKIVPIFLAFWIIIRGKKRTLIYFTIFGIIAITLPFLFQGVSFGIDQLVNYFNNFILKFASGDSVVLSYANQSLKATLLRMFTYSREYPQPYFTIFNLGEKFVQITYTLTIILLFLSVIASLIYRSIKKLNHSLFEPVSLIVFSHLVSGITWKAHLTSSVFFYSVIIMLYLSIDKEKNTNKLNMKNLVFLFLFLSTIISFLGKELIGRNAQLWMGGLGAYTWQLLFVLMFSIWWNFNKSQNDAKIESII